MKMRQQFPVTVERLMGENNKIVTLLGDIGVWSFNSASIKYPDRVYNIGILEQAMIGTAAGLAKTGMIPIVHTIAPFMVERAYEQLKLDFGYQKMRGNFVSVGASYDYSGLGMTHYCPADINILSSIPNMQIVLPGNAEEFDALFSRAYNNEFPTYFRISEEENSETLNVDFGKAKIIKRGRLAIVIAVGPMLEKVLGATRDIDVTVLYYNCIEPFDYDTLYEFFDIPKLIICEPYYKGAVSKKILDNERFYNGIMVNIGVPTVNITSYGTISEINDSLNLSVNKIEERIREVIYL